MFSQIKKEGNFIKLSKIHEEYSNFIYYYCFKEKKLSVTEINKIITYIHSYDKFFEFFKHEVDIKEINDYNVLFKKIIELIPILNN